MEDATSTCLGSPACDAQARAISRLPKPYASAAPLSMSGSAWMAFTAERGKTGRAMSPIVTTSFPSASTTATAPRWRLSTTLPRSISTSTGFAILALHPICCCRFIARLDAPRPVTNRPSFSRFTMASEPALIVCVLHPSHRKATVYGKRVARDGARLGRKQVGDRRGDLARLHAAALRRVRNPRAAPLSVLVEACGGTLHQPRRHAVDPHPAARKLQRHDFRQHLHPGLGGAIGRAAGIRPQAAGRSQVNNRKRIVHARERCLRGDERAHQIDFENLSQHFRARLLERHLPANARATDQRRNRAVGVYGLIEGLGNLVLVRH